jgi:murein DD-endopeptidase MepM/ murein hydrolase activator NlpD
MNSYRYTAIFSFVVICAGILACDDLMEPDRQRGCSVPYPNHLTSPYVLPYSVGSTFVVGQGNCTDGSHAEGTAVQFAYDFLMPIDTPIVAARDGLVIAIEERYTDGNNTLGQENYVDILHTDGTEAQYVHLTINGALVEVGEQVQQGDVIARSGNTGLSTEPHLHFHVLNCRGCVSMPVTFRNTRPHPEGLITGELYTAGPY